MFDKSDFNDAPAWMPEPGDIISGTVTQLDSRDAGHGEYGIVTIDTGEGPRAVHAFHVGLANQLAEKNVQVGDKIGILYHGKVENKKSAAGFHHGYKVKRASGGPQKTVDWSKLAPDADLDQDAPAKPPSSASDTPDAPIDTDGLPPVDDDDDTIPF